MRLSRTFARLLSLSLFIFISLPACILAAEPFFKKGDVIGLVGGEDMVVASEYGYLELLLVRALPDYHLRFRNLAWEGDTVFEQRRDLNFPTWEEQLDKIGATVVIAQFGQMESLGNEGKMKPGGTAAEEAKAQLPKFIAAYEKLLVRLSGDGKRRVIVLVPSPFAGSDAASRNEQLARLAEATVALVHRLSLRWIEFSRALIAAATAVDRIPNSLPDRVRDQIKEALERLSVTHRDGVHLSEVGHDHLTSVVSSVLKQPVGASSPNSIPDSSDLLRQLIIVKNRLWFDYWRPQNWAFLAGDRTAQPSSRDHLDPSKRWFPPEREAFLPLIEAKEKEIDALAQKLAQP